jgi:hypothetical protein
MDELMRGKCAYCFWWINLRRCYPSRAIANDGHCSDWRFRKMTDLEKKEQADRQKEAYKRDKAKKKKGKK